MDVSLAQNFPEHEMPVRGALTCVYVIGNSEMSSFCFLVRCSGPFVFMS